MTIVPTRALEVASISDAAKEFAAASAAPNTRRACRSDWGDFVAWCETVGRTSLPPEPATLADYVVALATRGLKASTITRRCSAIARAHRIAGHSTPLQGVARETLAGIRRTLGTAPAQVAPVTVNDLRRMVRALPATPCGARDRALLLVGFAGALRRSELVGLNVEDVQSTADGTLSTIRRSKTDQEGVGRTVGLPYGSHPETCPVGSLAAWLETAGVARGPVSRPIDKHGGSGCPTGRLRSSSSELPSGSGWTQLTSPATHYGRAL